MKYNNLIKYLENEIEDIEENHKDRWRGDSYYPDYAVERDKVLITEMACAINLLKDQMVN